MKHRYEVGRRAEVHWLDAGGSSGWQSRKSALGGKPINARTLAWILQETSTHITLVSTQADNDDVADRTIIPRSLIRKVVYLVDEESPAKSKKLGKDPDA